VLARKEALQNGRRHLAIVSRSIFVSRRYRRWLAKPEAAATTIRVFKKMKGSGHLLAEFAPDFKRAIHHVVIHFQCKAR